jgi:hypothetical protein
MADANDKYTITYDTSSAIPAAKNVDTLTKSVTQCDAAVTKSKTTFSGFAGGAARSAAGAETKVRSLGDALDELPPKANAAKESLKGIGAGAKAIEPSIVGLVTAFAALRGVEDVFEAIGKGINDARLNMQKLAEDALKTRDAMRELANLQGHAGPDNAVVGNALLLGMASGLKGDEAEKFLSQFEGSIPAGRQAGNVMGTVGENGLTEEAQKKFEKELAMTGAAFGARIGLDPATAGDLTGVVAQYTKLNSAEDLAGQLGAMSYGLNEGRGRISPLANSELGAAGNLVGSKHMADLAELSAFVGVASTVARSAGSSGTKVNQMDALLNTGANKKDYDYLKNIGVVDQKTDLEKLRVLRADLLKNGGDDWNGYLLSKGFNEKTERAATVAMASNFEVLDQRVTRARQETKNGGAVIKANKTFLETEITGANRQGEAALAASAFVQGTQAEHATVARKFALARLQARGIGDNADRVAFGEAIDTPLTNATDNALDLLCRKPVNRRPSRLVS